MQSNQRLSKLQVKTYISFQKPWAFGFKKAVLLGVLKKLDYANFLLSVIKHISHLICKMLVINPHVLQKGLLTVAMEGQSQHKLNNR